MTVKARTEITKEVIFKFMRSMFAPKTSLIVSCVILELFALQCGGIKLFADIRMSEDGIISGGSIVGVVAVCLVPVSLVLLSFLPLLMTSLSKEQIGDIYTYEFTDNDVTVDFVKRKLEGQSKLNYQSLVYVYETKDMFFLHTQKYQAYIIGKTDIKEGNVSNLRELLRKSVAHKYKFKGMKEPKQ